MLTVGLDYTPAYEQGGGIGRYVRELTAALSRQDSEVEYRLFVAGATVNHPLPSLPHNFSFRPTRLTPTWLARIWHRAHIPLSVEAFVGKVDLYHATDFVLPPTLSRTRTLVTVHDLSFVKVPEAASSGLRDYLARVVPLSAVRADIVLADSQATKNDLVSLYNLVESKVKVLLSGVDPCFRPIKDLSVLMTIRSKYRIGTTPFVLSIGTVQPRKNYARLIQALVVLRAAHYDLHLVIAGGKGWLADPIYETIRETRMQDFVHFVGFADETDLTALYSAATCFAFPSLYEGFGLPVLEAMACGTPVIASNISSLPEVAGNAALLVDPYDVEALADALKRVVDDQTVRENLIQRGYARAKEFSWDKSAHELIQIYRDLLA